MRIFPGLLLALLCLPSGQAVAQEVPRIKAHIISFDGKTITVTSGTAGQTLSVGLMPTTRLMYETKADPASIKPGDYLGATLSRSGKSWQADEVHLLPESLKGAGEGLYPLPSNADDRLITGAVDKNEAGQLSVSFRGSVGSDGPTCTGRAPRDGGCKGELSFAVTPKTALVAIIPGDKSILVAGKVAAISVIAGADGHLVTPGLTIENETGGEVLNVMPKPAKPLAK